MSDLTKTKPSRQERRAEKNRRAQEAYDERLVRQLEHEATQATLAALNRLQRVLAGAAAPTRRRRKK